MKLFECASPTLLFVALLAVCDSNNNGFTLHRNSITDENMRIYVASFNASDGDAYNRWNCEQAQLLFQAQPAIKTKSWCEKGGFRK